MKKNKYTIIITIVLAVIAIVLILNKSNSTIRRGVRNFAVKDTSNVNKIFLTDKKNRCITLTRMPSGTWDLDGKYTARKSSIDLLLKTIKNLSVREPVAKAAHNNIVSLLAAKSVKIEIYQRVYFIKLSKKIKLFPHEKLTKTYYVGDATQDNTGTYMLMKNSSEPFVVHIPGFRGYLSTRYSTIEDDWRAHTIFNIKADEIKSVKLEFPENPKLSYIFTNNYRKGFTIKSLSTNKLISNCDTLKVINYINAFSNIRFEAFINDINENKIDSITSSTPFHILTLTDSKGKSITIKTFHRKAKKGDVDIKGNPVKYDRDRLYALVNGGKDFTLVQFYTMDKILKPITYFVKKIKYQSIHK